MQEELKRKEIYYENLQKINTHNIRYKNGLETFEMGVNHFSDLTPKEFEEKHFMSNFANETIDKDISTEDTVDDESSEAGQIIWFKNVVQWYESAIPVRDQGNCHSCWSYVLFFFSLNILFFITKNIIFQTDLPPPLY